MSPSTQRRQARPTAQFRRLKGNKAKLRFVDMGLEVFRAAVPAGLRFSAEEIAEVVGCSRKMIWTIEERAKRKLRSALRQEMRNES